MPRDRTLSESGDDSRRLIKKTELQLALSGALKEHILLIHNNSGSFNFTARHFSQRGVR